MKKVVINPGCITCGRCEFIAPNVFEVLDVAYVKKEFDFNQNKQEIHEAIVSCPVQVIKLLDQDKSSKS